MITVTYMCSNIKEKIENIKENNDLEEKNIEKINNNLIKEKIFIEYFNEIYYSVELLLEVREDHLNTTIIDSFIKEFFDNLNTLNNIKNNIKNIDEKTIEEKIIFLQNFKNKMINKKIILIKECISLSDLEKKYESLESKIENNNLPKDLIEKLSLNNSSKCTFLEKETINNISQINKEI